MRKVEHFYVEFTWTASCRDTNFKSDSAKDTAHPISSFNTHRYTATPQNSPIRRNPFDLEDEFDIPLHMVTYNTLPHHQEDFGFDSPSPPSSPPLNSAPKEDFGFDSPSPPSSLPLNFAPKEDFGFDSPLPPKEDVAMDLTSPSQEVQHSGEAALPEAMDSAFRCSPKTKQGRS